MKRRFFISRSGRQYVLTENETLFTYDRQENQWKKSIRTYHEVKEEGRLMEVEHPDDFVHYSRKAYYEQLT